MKLVDNNNPITLDELTSMSKGMFDGLVKAVVDVKKGIMVVDAELHVDEEQLLLENESSQEDLWGINLYPDRFNDDFIEYDSMINLRPSQDNRTRSIDDPAVRNRIVSIVNSLVLS